MKKVLPTRIIVTETEETYYQIKVVVGTKNVVSNMEISGIDKALTDKVWVRENFMYDIPDLGDRIYFSSVLQEMIAIISESEREIVQVVYETDNDKFPELRNLGFKSVISENTKMTFQIKEFERIQHIDEEDTYENISTDVEHIKKFFDFHTQKITSRQTNVTRTNLVNIDDVVVFVGFGEQSIMVRNFDNSNYILKLDRCIVNDLEDVDKIMSNEDYKGAKFIIVVNNNCVTISLDIIRKYKDHITMCVYNTEDDFESVFLMSLCKRHGILHVKRIEYAGYFNLGVFRPYERCALFMDECKNGVITLSDNVWVENKSYVVFLDKRYANIMKIVDTMETCADVWTISIIHDIENEVKMYEYAFMPVYASEQVIHLMNMNKRGISHTPIAFYTRFPAIAKILFEGSIFVSCNKEHFMEYVNKVRDVFKSTIDKHSIAAIDRVNRRKTMAYNMWLIDNVNLRKLMEYNKWVKINYVKEAQCRYAHKKIVHQLSALKV